jgi:hypothetical protein
LYRTENQSEEAPTEAASNAVSQFVKRAVVGRFFIAYKQNNRTFGES